MPSIVGLSPDLRRQAETEALYAQYSERQRADAEDLRKSEAMEIPEDFDFDQLPGLSAELKAKLSRVRPENIHKVMQIEGMTPAAVTLLLANLRKAARRAVG